MKSINILICVFLVFLSACQGKESKQAALNESNLRRYLSNTFGINSDTLNTRLVLVDYVGCKPCINKHLHYLSHCDAVLKGNFSFVIPSSAISEFEENFSVYTEFPIFIDTANVMYRQNIAIEGLSIYVFKHGNISDIKTINIFTTTENELHKFWF